MSHSHEAIARSGGVIHRALENSDVIYLILEHCGRLPDWPWYDSDDYADSDAADDLVGSHIRLHASGRKSWRTLARCSRVCRAFSRPALRLLWRELPSLFPLCFVCLPMIRVDVERAEWEPVGQRIWTSYESPTEHGLQRFNYYAAFVRSVTIPADYENRSDPQENVDPMLVFHLSIASGYRPLLPNVKEIRCDLTPSVDMAVLCLAGDSLCELLIFDPHDGPPLPGKFADKQIASALRRLLRELPSRAPGLRSLYIDDIDTIHCLQHIAPIANLQELRSLRFRFRRGQDNWLGPFMSMLAKLEHLRDLHLSLGDWVSGLPPIPEDGFRELRRLCLQGYNAESDHLVSLNTLAGIMPRDLALERLDIREAAVEHDLYVGDLAAECRGLEILVTSAAKTLTWVTVDLFRDRDYGLYNRREQSQPTSRDNPSSTILDILAQLHNLQVCIIDLPTTMWITDHELRRLRDAWPLLWKFDLKWRREKYSKRRVPTFNGVVDFIWDHPHLRKLELSALDMGVPNHLKRRVYWPRTLPEGLTVPEARIRDPVVLGQVLRTLFEDLHVWGDACDERGVDESSKWGRVLLELGCYADCGHRVAYEGSEQ